MATEFDEDTSLERRPDGWHGHLTGRWHVGTGGPNGGYVASFLLRAMAGESPFPNPLTMTTHFLAQPSVGPVRVAVEALRVGRSHAMLHPRLLQDDVPKAAASVAFAAAREGGPDQVQATMPAVSPPDESPPLDAPWRHTTTINRRFEYRVPPEGGLSWSPEGPRKARLGGWTRLVDRHLDPLAVPLFMDAWPPAMFATFLGGVAPTIELTVHWRSRPHTPWHLAVLTSRFLMGGYVEEDGELWGEDGHLVAQSRQLSLFFPPEG